MNNKKVMFGIIIVVAVATGGTICMYRLRMLEAELDSGSPLVGLDGVFVSVHLNFERNDTNEDAVAYKGQIERLLQANGIRVLSVDEAVKRNLSDNPGAHLAAFIEVARAKGDDAEPGSEPLLVYSTRVEVLEKTKLIRSPGSVRRTRTWGCSDHGVMPGDTTCRELCETARDCIDSYIKEFLQANPIDR